MALQSKGRLCHSNLLSFYEKVNSSLDKGKAGNVVYLNFVKAFYTVPHKPLILKLRSMGREGNVCTWVGSSLKDQVQSVMVSGSDSEWSKVSSRALAGSVPIPFAV